MNKMKTKRTLYFDVLNILACIAVIILHHNGVSHIFMPNSTWAQALIPEVLFYWAVPIFFMLTGATLMEYRDRYDTYTFFKQRIKRTFIPFLLWSFIAAIFLWIRGKIEFPNPVSFIVGLLQNSYQSVYWFFIPLFGLYLMIPIVSLIKDNKQIIRYSIILLLIWNAVIPFGYTMAQLFYDIEPNKFFINNMAGPLLYMLLGYAISKNILLFGGVRRC